MPRHSGPWTPLGFVRGGQARYRPHPVIVRPNIRGGRAVQSLLCAAAWCASAAFAQAQPEPADPPAPRVSPELERFEGRAIRQITFASPAKDGALNELDARTIILVKNNVRLVEGVPFASRTVSEDISRLTRLGRFRTVEARVQQLSDGSVAVLYLLAPQPVIQDVQSIGNREFSDEDLAPSLEALIGTPLDPSQLERACRRLEARYRDKGYYNALVTVDQDELEKNQIVIFQIREGARTKVSSIQFEGVKTYTPREVRGSLKTEESWLFKSEPLDQDKLDEDVGNIIKFYKDRGHLDVRADRVVTPSPDGREAIVTFVVDEGPIYTLRDLRIDVPEGAEPSVYSVEQLRAMLAVKPGDVYSLDLVTRSIRAIQEAHGVLGYADARVDVRELREPGQPFVDVLISIRQGRLFKTGVITIQGNTATRDDVIRERITIKPDRPLDTTEVAESKKRLTDARLFGQVNITVQPERDDEPGYRDVLVEVAETSTGSFNFGAGVSSDGGVFGTVSLNQRNFDATDLPESWGEFFSGEAFRGGGQSFTIALQPGDRVRNFSVSLADPSAFGTDYSLGGSLFIRQRIYDGYDEQRYGVEVRGGRRFGSRWNVSVPLRFESIDLSNLDDDAPTDYFAAAEDSAGLFSTGITLSRSSYDNVVFPSKGTRLQFGIDQFAGDASFTALHAEYSKYFKLEEDVLGRTTTLQLSTRLAYIPQDMEDVPFYNRLYLGGQSFRGFDFRAVAPIGIRNDNGEVAKLTVGGNFLFFLGAEVRKPLLTDILSGVVFIDSGTVDEDISLDHYRVSAGFGLRVYVAQLSPIPIAFDFGFPVVKEDTDEERFFTLSIDLPFR